MIVFGRNHWFRPLRLCFWDKSENFARLWLVSSLGHPDFFFPRVSEQMCEAESARFSSTGFGAPIPRCAIFLCLCRSNGRARDFPQNGQRQSEGLRGKLKVSSWSHDTFLVLFFWLIWVLLYCVFSRLCLLCFQKHFRVFALLQAFIRFQSPAWLWNVYCPANIIFHFNTLCKH